MTFVIICKYYYSVNFGLLVLAEPETLSINLNTYHRIPEYKSQQRQMKILFSVVLASGIPEYKNQT